MRPNSPSMPNLALAPPQRMVILLANTAVKPIARKATTLPRWKELTAEDPGVTVGEAMAVVVCCNDDAAGDDEAGEDDKGVVEVTAVVEEDVITGVSVVNVEVGVITTADVDDVDVINELVVVTPPLPEESTVGHELDPDENDPSEK